MVGVVRICGSELSRLLGDCLDPSGSVPPSLLSQLSWSCCGVLLHGLALFGVYTLNPASFLYLSVWCTGSREMSCQILFIDDGNSPAAASEELAEGLYNMSYSLDS